MCARVRACVRASMRVCLTLPQDILGQEAGHLIPYAFFPRPICCMLALNSVAGIASFAQLCLPARVYSD